MIIFLDIDVIALILPFRKVTKPFVPPNYRPMQMYIFNVLRNKVMADFVQ